MGQRFIVCGWLQMLIFNGFCVGLAWRGCPCVFVLVWASIEFRVWFVQLNHVTCSCGHLDPPNPSQCNTCSRLGWCLFHNNKLYMHWYYTCNCLLRHYRDELWSKPRKNNWYLYFHDMGVSPMIWCHINWLSNVKKNCVCENIRDIAHHQLLIFF